MKIVLSVVFFLSFVLFSVAQTITVPNTIYFADLKLELSKDARDIVQGHVDALRKNPKYFQMMVEKMAIYFPSIEKILKEEGVPDDFKYLCVQESSLIPDAVSTSNAVGYWQFKKESALEVGVMVNNKVDERMNIYAATRGACKYLLKNNFYMNNWLHTLLSYNMGLTGANIEVERNEMGKKNLHITSKTHWYILKYLAHKIAYENEVSKIKPLYTLTEYKNCANKGILEICEELELPLEELEPYNKWVLSKRIPEDKDYILVVPVRSKDWELLSKLEGQEDINVENTKAIVQKHVEQINFPKKKIYRFEDKNGLKSIIAQEGDSPNSLAIAGAITKNKFLKYNDLRSFDEIREGQAYYLEPKKNKGKEKFYTVTGKETVWEISQRFGIKKEALLEFNRMSEYEKLQEGRKLWLSSVRPENVPVEIIPVIKANKIAEVSSDTLKPIDKVVLADSSISDTTLSEIIQQKEEGLTVQENESTKVVPKTHIVQAGETFFSISRLYKIHVADLKIYNGMDSLPNLKVGQLIYLTPNEEMLERQEKADRAAMVTHTVSKGDSLYKIASQYGVSVKDIQYWNSKNDFDLSIGETLKIYKDPK